MNSFVLFVHTKLESFRFIQIWYQLNCFLINIYKYGLELKCTHNQEENQIKDACSSDWNDHVSHAAMLRHFKGVLMWNIQILLHFVYCLCINAASQEHLSPDTVVIEPEVLCVVLSNVWRSWHQRSLSCSVQKANWFTAFDECDVIVYTFILFHYLIWLNIVQRDTKLSDVNIFVHTALVCSVYIVPVLLLRGL